MKRAGKQTKPLEEQADPQAFKKLKNSLGIVIAVFAFLLYAQSISFYYTYDDPTVTYSNNIVTKGLSGIPYY